VGDERIFKIDRTVDLKVVQRENKFESKLINFIHFEMSKKMFQQNKSRTQMTEKFC
jgi:hypothetical protein